MNEIFTPQMPVNHKSLIEKPLCSIFVYAGSDYTKINTYISFLHASRISENYEVFIVTDNELGVGTNSCFREAEINLVVGDGFKPREQLYSIAAQSATGRYLLFVKGLIEFDGATLEESIGELESSAEKLSVSANRNFVLVESSHYRSLGGFGGLLDNFDRVGQRFKQADGTAIRTELELDKLRSMRGHRYKQEYLSRGLAIFDLPIQKTPHFEFIREYQNNPGLKFESTSFWKLASSSLAIHRMKTGETHLLHSSGVPINSAEQLCSTFVEIYERIRLEGRFQPIEVMATYDGKYEITDGLHRAAVACAVGYRKVPVIIKSVDRELSALMESLRNAYPREGQRVLYTPVDHPVFSHWKALRDDTRWMLIKDEFDWNGRKVLDIGSYTGYLSHKAAGWGGIVTGIEIDDRRLAQSKMINTLMESNVEFLHADFFEYLKHRNFDCILLFSVLHWVLKDKGMDGVCKALDILSSAAPVMFLDMGQDHEEKMRLKEWNHGLTINKNTIPDLVISNSKYKHFKYLGTGDTGRDVFKFTTFDENAGKRKKAAKYLVQFGSGETKRFYMYEGKLATMPIVSFLNRYGSRYHGKLVDIGCGNKPYVEYFNRIDQYIGVDLGGNKADIIANAKALPIESDSVDVVLCNQVVEHDAEPAKILAEISRILREDGVLILSAPQMGRLHGEPNDYYRFTKWGLSYLLQQNGMEIEVIEAHGGIFRAIGSHLNFFIIEYFGKRKCVKYILRRTIIALNNCIFSLLDRLVTWEKDTLGYNIIARRRGY